MTEEQAQEPVTTFVRADERTVRRAPRNPLAVLEADEMRLEELASYSRRMGRVTKEPFWRNLFVGTGVAVLGAAIGAVISFGSAEDFGRTFVVFALVLSGALIVAGYRMNEERAESIAAIKSDYDQMLSSYEAFAEIQENNT